MEGVGPGEVQSRILEEAGKGAPGDPLEHQAHQLLLELASKGYGSLLWVKGRVKQLNQQQANEREPTKTVKGLS